MTAARNHHVARLAPGGVLGGAAGEPSAWAGSTGAVTSRSWRRDTRHAVNTASRATTATAGRQPQPIPTVRPTARGPMRPTPEPTPFASVIAAELARPWCNESATWDEAMEMLHPTAIRNTPPRVAPIPGPSVRTATPTTTIA